MLCDQLNKLNKVSIFNFGEFKLQPIGFKIEQAFKKRTNNFVKIGPKRTIIRLLKGP